MHAIKKMHELNKEANEEANKAVGAFLSKDQIHRLHQIHHQVQGAQAFTDEHVQTKLKLTDAQKSDIDSIVQASNTEMRALYPEHAERSRGNPGEAPRAPQGNPLQG